MGERGDAGSLTVGAWGEWYAADPDAAQVALFHEGLGTVRRSAARLGVPRQDREDLGGEVFVRARRALVEGPDCPSSEVLLKAWLLGVLRNIARERRRRSQGQKTWDPARIARLSAPAGAASAQASKGVPPESAARSPLTLSQARALRLWRRGAAIPEIARREGVSHKAIVERLARALRKISPPSAGELERIRLGAARRAWAEDALRRAPELNPVLRQILQDLASGRTWRQIGAVTGLSRDAVRKRIYRLRRRLGSGTTDRSMPG